MVGLRFISLSKKKGSMDIAFDLESERIQFSMQSQFDRKTRVCVQRDEYGFVRV